MSSTPNLPKGHTLLEVLIALAIISAVTVLYVNSASVLVRKNEQQTLIDDIKNAIKYTRLNAITLGCPLYLEPIDPSRDWSKGMKLLKKNANKMELLHQWHWNHSNWSVSWVGGYSSKIIKVAHSPVNAISNGTFFLLNLKTHDRTKLVLNRLARVKLSQ
jgi:prepilin-type N-terminal cleavage/methylation domain-containing protein